MTDGKFPFEVQLQENRNMAYTHLIQSDRDRIEALIKAGHTQVDIASVLKVHKSTISREIRKRNRSAHPMRLPAESTEKLAIVSLITKQSTNGCIAYMETGIAISCVLSGTESRS